ncbi:MAG: glycosyltransferase family 1 protein [Bacteroides clarus]|uniref:glycosyltransferase family 1 protein n=1 Tax=Bacteroides clarus TaxID=626929 RepID=UPI00241C77A4|nr:glycosyltransferase family 1 protein [Bacteroides clarus]MBD9144780.1 glycosyltransferase family 1 protein [Bacteroides clarus]
MAVRILYVNGGLMNRGGIESYMMNYYRHFDRDKIQIDFVVHDAGGYGYYDEEIKAMGGRIFVLPQKSKHPLSYSRKLKRILIEGNYKIIHTHMDAMGAWVLKVAKVCGIPVRIAHSHNTKHLTSNPIKLFFLEQARKNINKYATCRMACSEMAGKWLFGNQTFHVIRNAIDIDKFKFNKDVREQIRVRYGIGNDFLIGHVGRFDVQKNHSFLIDVFAKVHHAMPNCKLMLIGEGYLKENILQKINELCLQGHVILTGTRDDVNCFYNAFDLFVLPSLFEGLPVVAVENQINGCPALLSSAITTETQISPDVRFIGLREELWYAEIVKYIRMYGNRRKERHINSYIFSYDIEIEAIKLQNIYRDLWNKN